MTPPAEMLTKLPIVVILGATATGKSKLAVSIARKFGGEIISADSMQVYKGLDILTNKMSLGEMQGVPHHMMSFVEPRQNYDITVFRKQALPLVERIQQNGKIPIIVGGTNYYIECLLWEILIDEKPDSATCSPQKRQREENEMDGEYTSSSDVASLFTQKHGNVEESDLENYSSEVLHTALGLCDPNRASNLHPNDRRKIIRSLQVYYRTGRMHSSLIAEQRNLVKDKDQNDENSVLPLGGPLRFRNSLCFWIQAKKELLHERINRRVDEMVSKGLRSELDSYIAILRNSSDELDFTRGLLQSIGFKEFNSYLQLPDAERYTEHGDELFDDGKDLLKIATRQYAKRQLQWISQRFLQPKRRQLPPIYGLDGNLTDNEAWENNVTVPAQTILENHLLGNFHHPLFEEKRVPVIDQKDEDNIVRYCDTCDNRAFVGKIQWQAHLAGRRHRKMKKSKHLEATSAETTTYSKSETIEDRLDTEGTSIPPVLCTNPH